MSSSKRGDAGGGKKSKKSKGDKEGAGDHVYDCIIVGAGISGVATAFDLHRTHGRGDLLILEAQNRVGGRVHSVRMSDGRALGTEGDREAGEQDSQEEEEEHVLECGGQWIGPHQSEINRLINELGLRTVKQYTQGCSVMDYQPHSDGFASMVKRRSVKPLTYKGVIPPLPLVSLVDLQQAIWRIDHAAWKVPLDRPWDALQAKEWDSMTLYTYLQKIMWTQTAKDTMLWFVQAVFCAEANEVSALHFLWMVHSCDGMDALLNTDNGAQNFKIKGGAGQIALRMLDRIQREGSNVKVHLNSPVTMIDQSSPQLVKVETGQSSVFLAKRVVLALPPPMATRIRIEPPMPCSREQLGQRMPMGTIIKTSIMFKSAFWRDKDFSGFFLSNSGLLQFGYDMTTQHGIVGFITGAQARTAAMMSPEKRSDMIVQQLAFLFSSSVDYVKLQVLQIHETNWTEVEHIRGAYFAYCPPGVLTTLGSHMRTPVDRIHFAGTETALHHAGYMNGALDAGFRVAAEVAKSLSADAQSNEDR